MLEGRFPTKANGHIQGSVDESAFDPPSENTDEDAEVLPNGYHDKQEANDSISDISSIDSESTVRLPEDLHSETISVEASTSRLQGRLDLMIREINEMKTQMERYKRRAEDAEEERDTLRDMIQKIRDSGALRNSKYGSKAMTPPEEGTFEEAMINSEGQGIESAESGISGPLQNARGNVLASKSASKLPDLKELERSVTTVLQQTQPRGQGLGSNNHLAIQSAPYATMLGVVLIGVGLMTWINGWQKGER